MVAHPSLPAKSVRELITLARARRVMRAESGKWGRVIREANIRAEQARAHTQTPAPGSSSQTA